MIHILIVGVGGVGGYFGGLLARRYEGDADIHIHFLSRGENLNTIQSQGIEVQFHDERFITKPSQATDSPDELPIMDYVLLCIKSYDLEITLATLTPCIDDRTVFVPLLNGVDSREKIAAHFPENLVTYGCANVVSRLVAPGRIERYSDFQKIHFGVQGRSDPRLLTLSQLLKRAEIDVTLTGRIEKAIWSKFIFISTAAAATTYFDTSFDHVVRSSEAYAQLSKLLDEVIALARAKTIDVSPNIKEDTLTMFRNAPPGSTTSMHSDFKKRNGRTELESLIGYVVKEAHRYQVNTPSYQRVYSALRMPSASV